MTGWVKLPDLNPSKSLVWPQYRFLECLWLVGKGEMCCITLFNPDFHDIICNKLKQTLINGHREGRDLESTKGLRIFLTRNYLAIWRTFVVGG